MCVCVFFKYMHRSMGRYVAIRHYYIRVIDIYVTMISAIQVYMSTNIFVKNSASFGRIVRYHINFFPYLKSDIV